MQAEYPDGLSSEIIDFDLEKMNKAISEGAKVTVFKKNSEAHKVAAKKYSEMTRNQRKRFRKQHRGW